MKSIDVAVFPFEGRDGFWFMRRNRDADAYFKAGGRLFRCSDVQESAIISGDEKTSST